MGELVTVGRRSAAKRDAMPDALLEFQSPTAALIALPVPFMSRAVGLLTAGLVVSTLAVCAVVKVDRVVTAKGKVVATAANLVVQPLDTAIVRSIDVTEGSTVKAGQVLARLDPTLATADVDAAVRQVASLSAEVARLQTEIDDGTYVVTNSADPAQQLQYTLFQQRHAERAFKHENYRQKISSLETQIASNLAQANYYRQRLGVASDVEAMRRQLEQLQVGSKLNTMAATDTRLEMTRDMVNAQAQADTGTRDLQALIAERDADEKDWLQQTSQSLATQGRLLSDAREQLKKANLHRQLIELRAPQDAVVLSVAKVSIGSVMQSGDQLFTLVPVNSPMNVETYVAASDAGHLHLGDPVVIKFDTFPFTTYGSASGTLQQVSADSFTSQQALSSQLGSPGRPSALATDTGADESSHGLYYKSDVSIDAVRLHDVPPSFHLVPGMPVTADIKVGKRTVLAYMLSRVMPAFKEGMREP